MMMGNNFSIDPNTSPSYAYWSSLLYYFENNKEQLSLAELQELYDESERCRQFFNMAVAEEKKIVKNGETRKIRVHRPADNISQEEVSPNIYSWMNALTNKA